MRAHHICQDKPSLKDEKITDLIRAYVEKHKSELAGLFLREWPSDDLRKCVSAVFPKVTVTNEVIMRDRLFVRKMQDIERGLRAEPLIHRPK